MFSEQHIQQKLDQRRKDHKLLSQKIGGLRHSYVIQTDSQEKFRLDELIKQLEAEHDQLDQEITALEKKLASTNKPTQPDYEDDDIPRRNQETVPIRVSFDSYSVQVEPDGFDSENLGAKVYASLNKLRAAQQADSRVPDGLKDPNRKIYKKGKNGEQIPVNDNEPVFADDVLESRPDAIKG